MQNPFNWSVIQIRPMRNRVLNIERAVRGLRKFTSNLNAVSSCLKLTGPMIVL